MSQRGSPQRAASPSRRKGAGGRLLLVALALARAAARRPGMVLASVAVIGGASAVAWNATMEQKARHPAPLFASPKTTASIRPEPPRRPESTASTSPAPTAAKPDQPAPVRTASSDPIGGLLKSPEGAAKPAPKPARPPEPKSTDAKPPAKPSEAKAGPQPRVASAQKALAKLGYGPIASDGILGTQTKQALERFEREKKLPVTGTLGPRTVRQLASLSGISIE
ncbi:peptidoglycan-binding domain-containing protein [Enterovirga rhinocerotis]|uniref:Putative peptidoglycan binding protein n=1 Tax=Enterovirga rhinocerotis TaxID=1339210 RepID=A0A4R7BV58_9HYPH|nr:peptidoglycan-binding domain-containing protein [Enterovirga rhinocerotis]TDR88942.1 putative peptidoglycan binding protein [Enterovirga rhinocerotis]